MFALEHIPSRVSVTSEFVIELEDVTDKSGVSIDLTSTGLYFKFYSRTGGAVYDVIWVPGDDNVDACKNCYMDDGKLFIVFQNYRFQLGMLMVKVGIAVSNKHFKDNIWDWWYPEQPSGIELTA